MIIGFMLDGPAAHVDGTASFVMAEASPPPGAWRAVKLLHMVTCVAIAPLDNECHQRMSCPAVPSCGQLCKDCGLTDNAAIPP